jgi:2'-hydroxyisoflavone reductase
VRLLVLGGTVFLGRAVVDSAIAAGHDVTTFNRGHSGADDPRVRAVRGDRTDADDLARLAAAGPWHAVIDTSPQVPREVLASAHALDAVIQKYVLVTSVSVYRDWPEVPVGAGSALFECASDAGADDGHYGELKAGCERAAALVLGERARIIRPGIILGPHENVGRLPWWLARMTRGDRVPVPRPDGPFQVVDVSDLADLLVNVATSDSVDSAPIVAVGPVGRDTFGDFVGGAYEVTGKVAALVEIPDEFLLAQGIEVWSELPLWAPVPGPGEPLTHHWDVDPSSAIAAGMVCRPLAETVIDTWKWWKTEQGYAPRANIGLTPDREAALLAAWDAGIA